MKKKTEITIEYFEQENYKAALRIASEFRLGVTEEERKQMKLGYECMVHEQFYKQIGKDVEEEICTAINVFVREILQPYKRRTA